MRPLLALIALLFAPLSPALFPQVSETAARRCPNDVPIFLEIKDPSSLIGDWTTSPLYQLLDGLGVFSKLDDGQRRGKDLLTAILPLVGDSVGIGLRLEMTPPRILVAGKDRGEPLKKFEDALRRAFPDLPKAKKGDVLGAEALEFGDAGTIARQSGWVYYCNSDVMLRRTLKLKAEDSLAATSKYESAVSEFGRHRMLVVGDLRPLVAKADGIKNPDNFLAVLLFHGLYDALLSAETATAGIELLPSPRIDLLLDAKVKTAETWATTEKSKIPPIADPRIVGRMHVDRDLAGFWEKRLDIVGERARPSLAEFSQILSIFFSGYSVEDVLAKLGRGIDLVATERPIDPKTAPDVILPGFALVLHGEFDDELATRWMTGFQTAIGVTNAGGGEGNRQPMHMWDETFEGQRVITSRFLVNANVGTHAIEYNFTPSIAVTKNAVVIGMSNAATKVALANIATLAATRGDFVDVGVPHVVDYLKKNIGVMADSRALSEGVRRAEAEKYLLEVFDRLAAFSRVKIEHEDSPKGSRWSFVVEKGGAQK